MNIAKVLSTIGINIDISKDADADLREYIDDSITFMAFIVDLERQFQFVLPDEMLMYDSLLSINNIKKIIIMENKMSDSLIK